jgi:membrane-associated phospholipid phosphatase
MLETLVNLDKVYTARIKASSQETLEWKVGAFFAHSGDSWFWLAGLGLIWLFSQPEWHRRAAILAVSIVIQAVFVLSIKFTIRRARPAGEWGAIYRKTDPHSFPSGHATRAFMLAFMALALGPVWFGIIVLIWAPMVSLARVYVGLHYLSDVVAGAFLGIIIGWVLLACAPLGISIFPWIF